jgi:hypothetical protein
MRYLLALATFLFAVVLGFGTGSYRAAAVAEFMALSATCEIVKLAGSSGFVTDRDKLIDAIATSPGADAQVKAALQGVRRSKQC